MLTKAEWIERATAQLRSLNKEIASSDSVDVATAVAECEHWRFVGPEDAVSAAFNRADDDGGVDHRSRQHQERGGLAA